jgi:hypothetical protein
MTWNFYPRRVALLTAGLVTPSYLLCCLSRFDTRRSVFGMYAAHRLRYICTISTEAIMRSFQALHPTPSFLTLLFAQLNFLPSTSFSSVQQCNKRKCVLTQALTPVEYPRGG